MKVLCSQEVVSPPRCEVVSCQVTAKASAPQVPWFVLCWWLQQGIREDRVWYKPIDFYALSCSSFRKSTRNLIEIAQRKSQVINLSPEKSQVFQEAYRVLKYGGRLAISDVVTTAPFPEAMRQNLALRSSCVTGASLIDEVEQMLQAAGFTAIRIQPKDESKRFIREWVPDSKIEDYLVSATI